MCRHQHSLTQTLKHILQFQTVGSLLVIWHNYTGGHTLCWNLLLPYSGSTMKTETASSSETSSSTYMAIPSLDPEGNTRTRTNTKIFNFLHTFGLSYCNMLSVYCLRMVILILLTENKVINVKRETNKTQLI
jgi:hypothetical protein